jgi:hypothetical protein
VVVEIKGDIRQLNLTSAVLHQLENHTLVLNSGKFSMKVPAELLHQLQNKLPEDQRDDSIITLKFVPLSSESNELVAAAAGATHAKVRLMGEVYEFSLSVTTKSGVTETLSTFDQPITLSLAVGEGFDSKRGGIYYIADNGKLEFVPANYAGGILTAQVSHFSKYAVLELDRTFVDVPANHWASPVIQELSAKLYVQGTSKDKFEPNRAITRAEFTAMLVHSLGLTTRGEISFADVSPSAWYAESISIASKAGIVNGRSAAKFDPAAQITREEITVMLMKAYELKQGRVNTVASTDVAEFKDMKQVSSWAVASVQEAARLGLIQGQSQGWFVPKGIASRAEATQVIYNLIMK